METTQESEIPASEHSQPDLLDAMRVSATEAKLSFLALRCWQDAMRGDHPDAGELSQRLERIIDEFDLLFGALDTGVSH